MNAIFATLLVLFLSLCSSDTTKVFYFSLDERFATRGMFLNLASSLLNNKSEYEVSTPPVEMISSYKTPANVTLLDAWFENELAESGCQATTTCFAVISSEMHIHAGLINSRVSNATLESLVSRLDLLSKYKRIYGDNLKMYFSNVIMRIPAYNGDFEEPWYWQDYGYLIYSWSFYTDRFNVLKNESDHEMALNISKQIPANALGEFLWRRDRNHALTMNMLDYQHAYGLFEKIWITLDDNAEFGLNRFEEREIRERVGNLSLASVVNIYPGADEVGLVMLSKAIVDQRRTKPSVKVVYRNETNKNAVPNYEGQSLNVSIQSQVNAAGGSLVNDGVVAADVLLLVNNWSTEVQHEAAEVQTPQNYSIFEEYSTFNGFVIFADVLYSNGGDRYFVEWLETSDFKPNFGRFTYAGWNTAGNTIGTCVSNGMLLFNTNNTNGNKMFTYYRLVEDVSYQASIRQSLVNYLQAVSMESISQDVDFYEKFVTKGFQASLAADQEAFEGEIANYKIENIYFPWNRTFEIGFTINKK